jgi:hypothetical protein
MSHELLYCLRDCLRDARENFLNFLTDVMKRIPENNKSIDIVGKVIPEVIIYQYYIS